MKTSTELQADVLAELAFEPSLDGSGIGVAVGEGVVTLTGRVNAYAEKLAAEAAAKRVGGVHGVANDLKVELWPGFQRDDTAIAHAAVEALRWNSRLPEDAVTVTVRDGWITLEGTLPWQYQRQEAEKTVQHLQGVRGVTNEIVLEPPLEAADVEHRIRAAFTRAAQVDGERVRVEVSGTTVFIHGTVRSYAEHEDAERAAWSVPGVTSVRNELHIVVDEHAEV